MNLLLGTSRTNPVQDLALLVARVSVGVILIAHGWQKFDQAGIGATADGFAELGIPAPDAAAYFAIGVELIGGALLILGLLTPVVGVLVIADMAGAFWFVHRDAGLFVADGGWELVALIATLALTLAATGAGRLSLDRVIASGRTSDRVTVDA